MNDAGTTSSTITQGLRSSGGKIVLPSSELRHYAINHIARHLSANRQLYLLYRILTDISFIEDKVSLAGSSPVVNDYSLAIELNTRNRNQEMDALILDIRTALIMSSNALDADCKQVHPHLHARLAGNSALRILTDCNREPGAWLRMRSHTMATSASGGLIRTLVGHRGHITRCALSSDCKVAISSSQDFTLRMWDLATGDSKIIAMHEAPVASCALCAAKNTAVSASHDGTLRLINISNGKVIRRFKGHADRVVDCALSEDGNILLSASHDKTLRVWSTETGKCSAELRGHSDRISCCALNNTGTVALSGSHDGTLRLWRTDTGDCTAVMAEAVGAITSCDLSSDGNVAISARSIIVPDEDCDDVESPNVSIYFFCPGSDETEDDSSKEEIENQEENVENIWEKVTKTMDDLELPPEYLAESDNITVWNTHAAVRTGILKGHEDSVNDCALTESGELAVSAAIDGAVIVWDVLAEEPLARLPMGSASAQSCAVSQDMSLILSADAESLRLWDVDQASNSNDIQQESRPILECSYDSDGRILTSLSFSDQISRWDAKTCQRLSVLRAGDIVTVAAVSADAGAALVAFDFPMLKQIGIFCIIDFDSKSQACIASGHDAVISDCAIDGSGNIGITASYDRTLRAWGISDANKAKLLKVMKGHKSKISTCAINDKGDIAISGSHDGEVVFWDIASGKCIFCRKICDGTVSACKLSADGSLVLLVSDNRTFHIWSTEKTNEEYRISYDHEIAPVCALSQDGSWCVHAVAGDGVAVVDLRQRKEVARFFFDTAVRAVAIAPYGRDLAVGDVSGRVHFLSLTTRDTSDAGRAGVGQRVPPRARR